MAEKVTNSLPIDPFCSEKDDFEDWILRFESAVVLSTNATDKARKHSLFQDWLSLKLDNRSRIILATCKETDWDKLKLELRELLIDPQEKYDWRARRTKITWDGKESFHILATKIMRSVDKYDPKANKEQEYFFRFRDALPLEYRRAIDLGVPDDKQTIDEAKKIAHKVKTSLSDTGGAETVAIPGKAASFVGASMSHDRVRAIELSLQGITERMENMELKMKYNREADLTESQRCSSSRERYEARHSDRSAGRDHNGERDRHDRGEYRDCSDQEDHRDRRDRGDYRDRHDQEDYRARHDREDYRNHHDQKDYRDRHDCKDYRSEYRDNSRNQHERRDYK